MRLASSVLKKTSRVAVDEANSQGFNLRTKKVGAYGPYLFMFTV